MRESSMNGHRNAGVSESYMRANENAARVVAYLGPYLFWGIVATIVTGVMLLQ